MSRNSGDFATGPNPGSNPGRKPRTLWPGAAAAGVYTAPVASATDPLDCICAHLRRTARSLTAAYDEVLRPSGLRSTQFTLLHALSLKNGTSLGRLATQTGVDRTTLTRSLQTLEASGWVKVTPGREDKRRMLVHLTPEGRKALSSALPLWRKAQAGTLVALNKKSWEKLYRRLQAIEAVLEPGSGDGAKAPLDSRL